MNEFKVKFIDTSHECFIEMTNLSKKGLRSSGKIITKILKQKVPVKTGGLKKSIYASVLLNKETNYIPTLKVGYLARKEMEKKGYKYWVNPTWFEFGTKSHVIMTQEFKKDGKSSYKLTNKESGAQFGVIVQHPGMKNKNFLRNTVYENIDAIKQAQIEYLGQLTNIMISAGAKIEIDEEDEEID